MAFDAKDPDQSAARPAAAPRGVARGAAGAAKLAFVRSVVWDQAARDTEAGFAELVEALGEHVDEVELSSMFGDAIELHGAIMQADLAKSFAREYETGRDRLSARLCEMIESGSGCSPWTTIGLSAATLNAALDQLFTSYDAISTAAAPGKRPEVWARPQPGVLHHLDALRSWPSPCPC